MEWNWSSLETLGGGGAGLPALVERLLAADPRDRAAAHGELYARVVNQGDLYAGAAGVVDVLLAALRRDGRLPGDAWHLLDAVVRGSSYGRTVEVGGRVRRIDEYCRSRVVAALPDIDRAAAVADDDEFSDLSLLLGALGRDAPQVIGLLERERRASTGERREAAADALEEALDVRGD